MTVVTTEVRDQARVDRVISLLPDESGLRVLDLASRVGVFLAAMTAAGADVTGVEGRAENIEQMPTSLRARTVHADVRDLAAAVTGPYDVTLCLGILYHLELPDALRLLQDIAAVTTGVLIIDTHISAHADTSVVVDGFAYTGMHYYEGDAQKAAWASIGNSHSWWFTAESLVAALTSAGFRDISPIPGPAYPDELPSRRWFTARSGGQP